MKNLTLKLFILFITITTISYPMCCAKRDTKKVAPKAHLMQLINNSDLAGVRTFTQTKDVQYIDKEACTLAKTKFEATGIKSPPFSSCNEFLIMVLVQALAPQEIKEQLGLPH